MPYRSSRESQQVSYDFHMEEDKSLFVTSEADDSGHGWQKVTYAKKQRKNQSKKPAAADLSNVLPNGSGFAPDRSSVFSGLEQRAEERRRKLEAQRAATVYDDGDKIPRRSRDNRRRDDDDDDSSSDGDAKNIVVDASKKEKPKKVKKPKITLTDAAEKIDPDDLVAFLSNILESYEGQQDIQLMRFADYFGRAFSAVHASQFPWLKLFRESSVTKIADVPVSYISEAVYKTSVDWINHQSYDALGTFVIWSLDSIFADLASQLLGTKGVSKKGARPVSSKSQVAMFLTLAMVLRRKPDVLINLLPKLSGNSKYQGQDKLPVFVWMIVQASQGDLPVGLYLWAHHILPILGGKLGSNPQTRDLVLQLVERILAAPKARGILLSNAARKGERLVPPAALDPLLHFTFPSSSGRVKATERFEAVYPLLKEIALTGSPGSKSMKQLSLQIQAIVVKAASEGIPTLSEEAINIFIWCLTQNPKCYEQWEKVYVDNMVASVSALRILAGNWKELSPKLSSHQTLKLTLNSFRQKNDEALNSGEDVANESLYKDADKYSKAILRKLSGGHGCLKSTVVALLVVAVGAAVMAPNIDILLDWSKVSVLFNSQQSF